MEKSIIEKGINSAITLIDLALKKCEKLSSMLDKIKQCKEINEAELYATIDLLKCNLEKAKEYLNNVKEALQILLD
jgi:seryl-tRNA synthetase